MQTLGGSSSTQVAATQVGNWNRVPGSQLQPDSALVTATIWDAHWQLGELCLPTSQDKIVVLKQVFP